MKMLLNFADWQPVHGQEHQLKEWLSSNNDAGIYCISITKAKKLKVISVGCDLCFYSIIFWN